MLLKNCTFHLHMPLRTRWLSPLCKSIPNFSGLHRNVGYKALCSIALVSRFPHSLQQPKTGKCERVRRAELSLRAKRHCGVKLAEEKDLPGLRHCVRIPKNQQVRRRRVMLCVPSPLSLSLRFHAARSRGRCPSPSTRHARRAKPPPSGGLLAACKAA